LKDGHVRVDIFYREVSVRRKALVNLFGVVLFLLPLCYITWMLSWSYVANAWAVREGSTEVSGLPFIYLFKTVILVFIVLVVLQGLSLALRSLMILTGMQWVDEAGGSPDSDYQGPDSQGTSCQGKNVSGTD
jgi:TRAP-type mannitol/chloroaromatic compound transport system permease small subunit